jgi:hypothetical protein
MNFDFSEILDDPRFQSAIGPDKYEQYSSDEAGQQMIEDFENDSQTLMTLTDNGGGDVITFREWHGFYFWKSHHSTTNGASHNLEDLFDDPAFDHPPHDIAIESKYIPKEVIEKFAKKLLITLNNLLGSTATEIQINGTDFKLAGDELVEV